jgi:uncharacterized Zn-finger protein
MGAHECKKCGKEFKKNCFLKRHFETVHEKKKPHTCPQCNKTFGRQDVLKKHIKLVHEEATKKFKCEICEYGSNEKHHLKEHFAIVHEEKKPQKCPHCSKHFSTKGNMNQHISSVHENKLKIRKGDSIPSVKSSNEHLVIETSEVVENMDEVILQEIFFDGQETVQFVTGNGNSTETNVLYLLPEGYPNTPSIEDFLEEAGVNFDFE